MWLWTSFALNRRCKASAIRIVVNIIINAAPIDIATIVPVEKAFDDVDASALLSVFVKVIDVITIKLIYSDYKLT